MRVWFTNFFAREVPCTLEISVTLEGGEHPPQLVDFLRERADRLWTNPDGSMLAVFIREFRLESLQQRLPRFLRALELRLLRLGLAAERSPGVRPSPTTGALKDGVARENRPLSTS